MNTAINRIAGVLAFSVICAAASLPQALAAGAFVSQIVSPQASDAVVRQLPPSARARFPQAAKPRVRAANRQAALRRQQAARRTNSVQAITAASANITDFGSPDSRRPLKLPNVRDGVSVRIIQRRAVRNE